MDDPEALPAAVGRLARLREARVTSRLEHPGILPIYTVGETPHGVPYDTMRYVRGGRTPAQAIRETEDPEEHLSLLEPFLRICDTVHWAHTRGVVHRDLKPANVAQIAERLGLPSADAARKRYARCLARLRDRFRA